MKLSMITAHAPLANGLNAWLTTPIIVPLAVTTTDLDCDIPLGSEVFVTAQTRHNPRPLAC